MKIRKLAEMAKMQEKLDHDIIVNKDVLLTPDELFDNTLVALDVELAEFANEGRWFKFWSENQEPKTYDREAAEGIPLHLVKFECMHCGEKYPSNEVLEMGFSCRKDGGEIIAFKEKNPFLEEYVDCLHFLLSLANQKEWQDQLQTYQLTPSGSDSPIIKNRNYLRLKKDLAMLHATRLPGFYIAAWENFWIIGIVEMGFTFDEVYEAYKAKNAVNHVRQGSGY